MFDFSHATVKPWPEPLPFGTRHSCLTGVRWGVEECTFEIEISAPGSASAYWHFTATRPVEVVIERDEEQVVTLWVRRNECCEGAGGFLVVEDSPMLAALLGPEAHLELNEEIVEAKHFVLGTDYGVAHILARDTPQLSSSRLT